MIHEFDLTIENYFNITSERLLPINRTFRTTVRITHTLTISYSTKIKSSSLSEKTNHYDFLSFKIRLTFRELKHRIRNRADHFLDISYKLSF